MTDIEQLQKDLQETIRALETIPPGTLPHRLLAEQKAALEAQLIGSGAIAQNGGKAVGAGGTLVEGNVIVIKEGGMVVIGEQPVEMKAKLRETALGRYLEHVIAHNRYLQLQGIRSGGKLVNIELEQIYITLRTTQRNSPGSSTGQRTAQAEEEWLKQEAELAPGEMRKHPGLARPAESADVLVSQCVLWDNVVQGGGLAEDLLAQVRAQLSPGGVWYFMEVLPQDFPAHWLYRFLPARAGYLVHLLVLRQPMRQVAVLLNRMSVLKQVIMLLGHSLKHRRRHKSVVCNSNAPNNGRIFGANPSSDRQFW